MARLELDAVSKRYGDFYAARDVTLDVSEGELLVLLGPSGCGKTTTLRMIAGFVEPTSGAIRIGGEDVTWMPPWRRNTGLVFQNYALFPHLTVAKNLAFGLEMRKMDKAQIERKVHEALALVRLDHLSDRLPRQLSGGQQQRVALARALVFEPDVLLLDEPLSNLDAKLRNEVRIEIRNLQQRLGITTVMVTHDQEEALTMADRLVVMSEGQVRQVGSQQDLYERPSDRFVAGFVGRSSFIRGRMHGDVLTSAGGLENPLRPKPRRRCRRRAAAGTGQGGRRRVRGRQQLFRHGRVRLLHGRPDRHPCSPLGRGRGGRAGGKPRRRTAAQDGRARGRRMVGERHGLPRRPGRPGGGLDAGKRRLAGATQQREGDAR